MKITESSKYVVLYERQPITRGARRQDAHAVKTLLGSEYIVWNRYTRRESKDDNTAD